MTKPSGARRKRCLPLFDCSTDNIGLHPKNIFTSGELRKDSTTEFFSVVQTEGGRQVSRKTLFYNLDAIISVGYRETAFVLHNFANGAHRSSGNSLSVVM